MTRGLLLFLSPIVLFAILIACGDDGGTPTSPTPAGKLSLSTISTFTSRGASFMRAT